MLTEATKRKILISSPFFSQPQAKKPHSLREIEHTGLKVSFGIPISSFNLKQDKKNEINEDKATESLIVLQYPVSTRFNIKNTHTQIGILTIL